MRTQDSKRLRHLSRRQAHPTQPQMSARALHGSYCVMCSFAPSESSKTTLARKSNQMTSKRHVRSPVCAKMNTSFV
jgi:hypothetical protein